ncbi:hypothetical protein CRG98_033778 [Punica granatum]|uniref:Retrovirus-related Pol polyprotein from transposon TNT 1-94-like beta-barrel domain-containing protein n=1 Tax=Punica granatum TaxID=22663 RepID=A0A2I0IP42_PUNGR|nr:hypothetical protein CRG98_033778 [Punica granatum]
MYEGLNLVRDFERLQMKESETITEYSTKLINIANKARILSTDLSDNRTKDLSQIKLGELISALQAPEYKRSMRLEGSVEGALKAKVQQNPGGKEKKCWRRPDVRCRKCNKLGHIKKFYKKKGDQQPDEAHVAVQQELDQLFVASCFTSSTPCDGWHVDSSCTNHMTSDEKLFRSLDKSMKSKVRIGNGEYLTVEGKGTVAMKSCVGYGSVGRKEI